MKTDRHSETNEQWRRWVMRKSVRCALAIAAVGLFVGILVGCGSSSDGTSGSTAASTDSSTTSEAAGLPTAMKVYGAYLGAKPGAADPSQAPIQFGLVTQEGGALSFPSAAEGAKAAVKYVNEELGGVQGHQIQLVECAVVDSEPEGQACAQQFLSDKSITAVVQGVLPLGGPAFHQTLAGKLPVITTIPVSLQDANSENSFAISAGVFGFTPGVVKYSTESLKAKSASLLYADDDPSSQLIGKEVQAGLEKAGVQVSVGTYQSSSPSLSAPVLAAKVGSTDVAVLVAGTPSACVALAKATEPVANDEPIVAASSCLVPPVKTSLGDYPKWTYVSQTENVALPQPGAAVEGFLEVLQAEAPEATTDTYAQGGFMGVMLAAKVASEAGAKGLTPESFSTKITAYTGPTPMLPPKFSWGAVPELPAIGTLQNRFYIYQGDGSFEDAANGEWIG
jgi:branched-chain amino acid transport system substrate-binding protein